MAGGSYSINTRWYLELNTVARHSTWAHGVMKTYSHDLGIALLAVVLLGAWWWARRAPTPARAVAGVLWVAGGTVVAWVIAHYGLKPLVAERRPYLALPHVEVLLTRTTGYSFPSGHATVAGAVIVGLLLARRPVAATLAVVLGLLLGFGRVYTGMHYPFDVVGGLVIGGAVVAVLWPLAVPVLTRIDQRLLRTPLAPLVATAQNRPTAPGDAGDQGVRSATAASSAAASSEESGR
ncbi:MAG: phosphatase PAP2 family protein [Acidimicrobiales bacterium]